MTFDWGGGETILPAEAPGQKQGSAADPLCRAAVEDISDLEGDFPR